MRPVTVRIERLVPGGRGLARLPDGRVCFVEGVLPGERVAVRPRRAVGDWTPADLVEVHAPSPDRRPPPCPHAHACGGCPLSHAREAAQPGLKAEMISDALRRIGGIPPDALAAFHPAPEPLGWRHRVRLQVSETGATGFFRRGSHQVHPVEACRLAIPAVQGAQRRLSALAAWRRLARICRSVEIVGDPADPYGAPCHLVLRGRGRARPRRRDLEALSAEGGFRGVVWLPGGPAPALSAGAPTCSWPYREIPGVPAPFEILASPACFTQVNWPMNLVLVRRLVKVIRRAGARTVLDLYSGIGNFSLPLATAGLRVQGVETDPAAVAAAREAARRLGLDPRAAFRCARAEDVAREPLEPPPDVLLLDPPRRGAGEILPALARGRPRLVAYVSCDPATLARDLRRLLAEGYALGRVEGFDLFPQTAHAECLAILYRDGAEDAPTA
ncbi:class I SAM-dependent RNA methyltransferase [Dissulfurirhabdus thermomarina]|nr:class I SAM-dependent RNA methyltransferase [Dissulfurirhabdus thermomarina]